MTSVVALSLAAGSFDLGHARVHRGPSPDAVASCCTKTVGSGALLQQLSKESIIDSSLSHRLLCRSIFSVPYLASYVVRVRSPSSQPEKN